MSNLFEFLLFQVFLFMVLNPQWTDGHPVFSLLLLCFYEEREKKERCKMTVKKKFIYIYVYIEKKCCSYLNIFITGCFSKYAISNQR